MRVYRLCKARWALTAFSGEGSLRFDGRWHFAGVPMVYTASSQALAALEILVHMEIRHAPADFVLIPAELPAKLAKPLKEPRDGWDHLPPNQVSQQIGTDWFKSGKSVGLRVPSVVIPGEMNVLLNPLHSDFKNIEIHEPQPFSFDPRLLRPKS